MTWRHESCRAMFNDPQAPTAPLADFIDEYEDDDNVWWMIACGHHQNLFEAAVEERALADDLAEVLSGFEHIAKVPSDVSEVLARYREARGR